MAPPLQPLRVLIVDDSPYSRLALGSMLESFPGVEVVGRAQTGAEALRAVYERTPDVITLDLDMPEMDGFAFLRLLMGTRPTPVFVVSAFAQREHVFRALELGALDFVAKPTHETAHDLRSIERDLLNKIEVVRKLRVVNRGRLAMPTREPKTVTVKSFESTVKGAATKGTAGPPRCVVGIASSTGGPPTLQGLLSALPASLPSSILIAQHMPPRFTGLFAARLDRIVAMHVVEATDGDTLRAGMVYLAPGSANLELDIAADRSFTTRPRIRVVPPPPVTNVPTITPSGDRLFKSLAAHFGPRLCVIVLSGMGSDGREGAVVAHKAGAHIIIEDPGSAVMPGMPLSVADAGVAHEIVHAHELADALLRFVSRAST